MKLEFNRKQPSRAAREIPEIIKVEMIGGENTNCFKHAAPKTKRLKNRKLGVNGDLKSLPSSPLPLPLPLPLTSFKSPESANDDKRILRSARSSSVEIIGEREISSLSSVAVFESESKSIASDLKDKEQFKLNREPILVESRDTTPSTQPLPPTLKNNEKFKLPASKVIKKEHNNERQLNTKKLTLILSNRVKLPMTKINLQLSRSDSNLSESDIVNPETVQYIYLDNYNNEMDNNSLVNIVNPLNKEEILNNITKLISKSRKIMILTGAGISCNAGIPDFRSSDGLYNQNLNELANSDENQNLIGKTLKGKEMFDVSVYRSIETIKIFNIFIQNLYRQILKAKPTRTHHFISKLNSKNKLIKCYTQNIDGIERQCGLNTSFSDSKWQNIDVVQLHGDLHQLSCSNCKNKFEWGEIYEQDGSAKRKRNYQREVELIKRQSPERQKNLNALAEGKGENVKAKRIYSELADFLTPSTDLDSSILLSESEADSEVEIISDENVMTECPSCIANYEIKLSKGKRCCESSIGIIRPNIVLYGENHPFAEVFAQGISKDLSKNPNLLLIFGTSLKVSGVKGMVRKISKKIHDEGGKVVLVNKDPISNSSWKGYIDYQIMSDCDKFCEFVEGKMPKLFG
ncbi:NAD-dependent histone deacetylase [Martiniozyma asiatica (nom. inval.)]|nr:NAD-dependent histone deacetylase [Martiniozyma asiatica]